MLKKSLNMKIYMKMKIRNINKINKPMIHMHITIIITNNNKIIMIIINKIINNINLNNKINKTIIKINNNNRIIIRTNNSNKIKIMLKKFDSFTLIFNNLN